MKRTDFTFDLPPELIATQPAEPRDAARLLHVVPGSETPLRDHAFLDLPALLHPGDLLVFNNTKVIPARLYGTRGEARVEILLHQQQPADAGVPQPMIWHCFARPAKRLRVGDTVYFSTDFTATVIAKLPDGQVALAFAEAAPTFYEKLFTHGEVPLPPYITAQRATNTHDATHYQTMFAKHEGAVAAPTASLHYTPRAMAALAARGIHHTEITLHVGAGTFLPVKVDDIAEHRMHREWYQISPEAAEAINTARQNGRRIVAVGTTALRTLESAANAEGFVQSGAADTGIFITPGYHFKAVDALLTNFHLSESTLFMLVCAFSGFDTMHAAYQHAIAQRYRFFSYGDTSLLERQKD